MQGGGLGGSLSSLHYPFYPGGLKGNAASNVWLSLHTTPTIRLEFPIRLRLLQVRLSIIFEKMFEYFD